METTKRCTKCGEFKLLECFSPDRKGKLGKRADCYSCSAKSVRQHRSKNPISPQKVAEYNLRYGGKNKEKLAKKSRRDRERNAEALAATKLHRIATMHPHYIRGLLSIQYSASFSQIPDELVEKKRNQLILHRAATAALSHLKGKSK